MLLCAQERQAGKSRHDRGGGRLDRLKAVRCGVRGRWGELNGQWGGDEARERCNGEREDEVGKFGELRVSWDGDVWKRGGGR